MILGKITYPLIVPRAPLRDTTVAGVDVNMLLFLFGLAGATAVVASLFLHRPHSIHIRSKHRF